MKHLDLEVSSSIYPSSMPPSAKCYCTPGKCHFKTREPVVNRFHILQKELDHKDVNRQCNFRVVREAFPEEMIFKERFDE